MRYWLVTDGTHWAIKRALLFPWLSVAFLDFEHGFWLDKHSRFIGRCWTTDKAQAETWLRRVRL